MKLQIEERTLGREGLSYVRDCLRGGKELSTCLLQALDLESGKLTTFLPAHLDAESIVQFSVGGKLPLPQAEQDVTIHFKHGLVLHAKPVPNVDDALISIVQTHLRSSGSALCILENQMALPADPWLKRTEIPFVTHGTSVYHMLISERTDRNLVELTVKKAKSIRPPLICALGYLSEKALLNIKLGTIGLGELREFAGQTQKIAVGAYDGESYVIWSR